MSTCAVGVVSHGDGTSVPASGRANSLLRSLFGSPLNIALTIGFALLLLYFRLMRQADRYAVITGKGYRPKEYKLKTVTKRARRWVFMRGLDWNGRYSAR